MGWERDETKREKREAKRDEIEQARKKITRTKDRYRVIMERDGGI